jgi:hypothetical protein
VEVPVELPEGVSNMARDEEQTQKAVAFSSSSNTVYSSRAVQSLPATGRGARTRSDASKARMSNKPAKGENTFILNGVAGGGSGGGAGVGAGSGAGTDVDDKLSPEEKRRRETLSKLHPAVAGVVNRLMNRGTQPSAEELKFVRDGRAEIQVWLIDKNPAAIEELKRVGFEVVLDPKTSRVVIGRIAIEKLSRLAELKSVRYIAPQLNRS